MSKYVVVEREWLEKLTNKVNKELDSAPFGSRKCYEYAGCVATVEIVAEHAQPLPPSAQFAGEMEKMLHDILYKDVSLNDVSTLLSKIAAAKDETTLDPAPGIR